MGQNCNFRLSGKVSLSDGTPVESASVTLSAGQSGSITNSAGKFFFTDLCKGPRKITVRHMGYEMQEKTVIIMSDTVVTITLEAEITELDAIVIHEESH